MVAKTELESAPLKISHIWLFVKDVQKSIQFYKNAVGLEMVETFPHGALLKAGEVLIGIHLEERELKSQPGGTSITLYTNNIQKDYELLRQRGVPFQTHVVKQPYGLSATFKDPDGYLLELWQP